MSKIDFLDSPMFAMEEFVTKGFWATIYSLRSLAQDTESLWLSELVLNNCATKIGIFKSKDLAVSKTIEILLSRKITPPDLVQNDGLNGFLQITNLQLHHA